MVLCFIFPNCLHCLWTNPLSVVVFAILCFPRTGKGKSSPSRSRDLWQSLFPRVGMELWPPELSKRFRSWNEMICGVPPSPSHGSVMKTTITEHSMFSASGKGRAPLHKRWVTTLNLFLSSQPGRSALGFQGRGNTKCFLIEPGTLSLAGLSPPPQ